MNFMSPNDKREENCEREYLIKKKKKKKGAKLP